MADDLSQPPALASSYDERSARLALPHTPTPRTNSPEASLSRCPLHANEWIEGALCRTARFDGFSVLDRYSGLTSHYYKYGARVRILSHMTGKDPQEILRKHTCAPYEQAFWHHQSATKAKAQYRRGEFRTGDLISKGLVTSKPRFCARCVSEDTKRYPYTLWLRQHQIRGIDRCHICNEPLWVANVSALEFLPGDRECLASAVQLSCESSDNPLAKAFGEIALKLLDRAAPVPLNVIAAALKHRAKATSVADLHREPKATRTVADLVESRSEPEREWMMRDLGFCSRKTGAAFALNLTIFKYYNNTAANIIAALLLTDSPEDAAAIINNPADHISGKRRPLRDTTLQSLYEQHHGRLKCMARSSGNDVDSLREKAHRLGLPACGDLTESDITALTMIESGEQFEAVMSATSANARRVTQFLSIAARPRLRELLKIARQET